MRKPKLLDMMVAGLMLSASSAWAGPASEVTSTAAARQGVAVTIYNDNLALVKETRRVELAQGANHLAWRDVAARMQPETAQLRNMSVSTGFTLLEQRFDFDLLTPQSLLDNYIGREVIVIRSHPVTGSETRETATVLSTRDGVVLQFADRIETGVPGRLAFPGVPADLRDTPTLVVSLSNPKSGPQNLELSYLTGGLSWRADYVAELNAGDDQLDLNGWVTLTNQSGAAYPDAKLQLVTGELNRVRDMQVSPRSLMTMAAKGADVAEMRQESLLDYHLYTMQHSTTLKENQTKQLALMSAMRVPAKKTYLLAGADYYYGGQQGDLGRKIKIGVFVEFRNRGEGLGIPLPRGVIRLYKKDSEGKAQFVGEDRIEHTPKLETVRLKLGDAFDLTADKKQTDFQQLGGGTGLRDSLFESAYEVVLKNARSQPVTVTVREPVPGEWTMVSESHAHSRPAAGAAEWQVKVPAEGSAVLAYRVRVRY